VKSTGEVLTIAAGYFDKLNREIDPVDEASEESSPSRMLQIRQERRRLRTTVQIALRFGIGAFARLGLTLGVLVFLHGAYALADGVSAIATALVGRPPGNHGANAALPDRRLGGRDRRLRGCRRSGSAAQSLPSYC